MSFSELRLIGRLMRAAALMACMALPGCALRQPRQEFSPAAKDPPSKASRQSEPAAKAADVKPPASAGPRATSDRELLAHREWILAVPPQEAAASGSEASKAEAAKPPAFQWRNPGLEKLQARPASRRVDLHPYLNDSDAVVAANAAIGLARALEPSSADRLAASVEDIGLPTPLRCAAIESLAVLPDQVALKRLQDLMDQFGDVAPASAVAYVPDIHAELVRGLARHIDAADDPRLSAALGSPSVEVRVAALHAWAIGRRGIVPAEVAKMRNDGNPRVRCAALEVLAARKHGEVRQYLADALRDCDLQVRVTAIGLLGELGDGQAIATLAELMKDRSDRMRGEAVTALARAGAKALVLAAVNDSSWRVRIRVARALAAYPDREGAAAARTLLDDQSAEVQKQLAISVAQWPLEQGGPILLEAMGRSSMLLRKTAADGLAALWAPAAEFPADALPPRRAESLQKLQEQFRKRKAQTAKAATPERVVQTGHAEPAGSSPSRTTAIDVQQVERLLQSQDTKSLAEMGPELVVALEQLAVDRGCVLPESVYHCVLPRHGAAFQALDLLSSKDVSERQRAAESLAVTARQQPLTRLVVARLSSLMTAETDTLVWRSALEAVAADASEPASRMATTALGHNSPEVRRRACQWLAAHPSASQVKSIVPLLEDSSPSVIVEAARALGACDHLDDPKPLQRLLGASNEELQLAAAVALTRLGDPAGTAALDRLSYSSDFTIRTRVAQAMGELGSAAFAPALVRLLDDRRPSVSRAALASLPHVAERDAGQRAEPSGAGTTEQIRRWKQWLADGKPAN